MPRPGAVRALICCILTGVRPTFGGALSAQHAPPSAQTPAIRAEGSRATGDTAVLTFGDRTIAVFRAPLGAMSPAERTNAALRRIEIAADSEPTDSVIVRPVPEGVLLLVGARAVFTLTRADVDTAKGNTLDGVARQAAAQLLAAVRATRDERSVPQLLTAVALAIASTILFLVALRLLRFGRRMLFAKLPAAKTRLSDLVVGGFTLLSIESLLLFVRRLVEALTWALGFFIAYLWLAYALTRFAYTRPWGEALGTYLASTVSRLALAALGTIPSIFTVIVIFVAARWAARFVGTFFDAVEARTVDVPWIHPETANPTKRIVVALLWLFAVVVAYPYVPGSGSDVFKGVSVFAGLVLSLGSSGLMNQAMSGLVLMYSRALRPGDYVRIGETEGTVTELGMLSTKVRTTKREEVTLPNAVVVSATIKNFSRTATDSALLLHTAVTIGYDTAWRQVEALLVMAARRTPGLRHESAFVLKTALSDFYVEYQLNVAIESPGDRIQALDRLHANILDCFNEYGVQIMSPHYETDRTRPAVVARGQWYAAPAQEQTVPSR